MYSDRDLEDYFAEYLEHYDFDDIRALLVVVDIEKIFGEQALIFHDKKRAYKQYTDSLNTIENILDKKIKINGIDLLGKEREALQVLRDSSNKIFSTKQDIKKEIEEDFAEDIKNPLFVKLLQDARNYIKRE